MVDSNIVWLFPMPRNTSLTVSNCALEKIGALASTSSSLSFSLCFERRFCPVNPKSLADMLQRVKTVEKAEKWAKTAKSALVG